MTRPDSCASPSKCSNRTSDRRQHSITEQRYDALGQLVESRAYATAVGHLDRRYDETTHRRGDRGRPGERSRSAIAYDAGGRQAYTVRELRVGSVDQIRGDEAGPRRPGPTRPAHRLCLARGTDAVRHGRASTPHWSPDLANDRTTTYVHDAAGRLRFEINPDLSFRETVYDALDQVTQTRQFDFTLSGNVPRTEAEMVALRGNRAVGDGVTRGQAHTYDAAGRLTSTIDAVEQYRALRVQRARRSHEMDRQERHQLDLRVRPQGAEDQGDHAADAVQAGRRGAEHARRPNRVLETRFAYDAFGNLIQKIEAANFPNDARTTDFRYDTVGRLTSTRYHRLLRRRHRQSRKRSRRRTASERETSTTLRHAGQRGAHQHPHRRRTPSQHTYRTYDRQGQVVHEVNALNHVTRYTYTSFGEPETVTRYSVTISGAPGERDVLDRRRGRSAAQLGLRREREPAARRLCAYDHDGVRQARPQESR